MVGVGGEPVVDELLDDPAPAEGRADVVPAAVALEVLRQLRVAGVPLAALGDLGLDVGVGDLEALGLGELLRTRRTLTRFSASGRKSAWSSSWLLPETLCRPPR